MVVAQKRIEPDDRAGGCYPLDDLIVDGDFDRVVVRACLLGDRSHDPERDLVCGHVDDDDGGTAVAQEVGVE